MSLYNISNQNLTALKKTTFAEAGLHERRDLQAALKQSIEAIAPDCLVISEEFSDWEDSRRRIDLLAIDKNANLVVIELKRDEVGAHMELQALRYAAMISNMTFDKACEYFDRYITAEGLELDAREAILDFVDLDESSIDDFGNDVRIVLASADFGKELTTSVLWLRDKQLDITCVRLTPYQYNDDILINAEQIIPVPEAEEYQIKFREKRAEQRSESAGGRDYSRFKYKDQTYNKRNLALALITDWIEAHQPNSLSDLLEVFDKDIRRRIALPISDVTDGKVKRYHSSDEDLIELDSGEVIAISNQWSIGSVTRLIEVVSQYGFEVTKVDS
ncbi:hypothetical protein L1D44_04770 [Shewanella sp. Isolate13]|uniref:hypothetical protein n=1 Tax=Shewanella sp. Isolate13 TaxID=2908531 RepID=UPI001EFC6B18|nr:hypothetical protein [Shewanella sp. Isolate13]MCG9729157.1 hypothetical protein [Shewanella sp. Isolate13]